MRDDRIFVDEVFAIFLKNQRERLGVNKTDMAIRCGISLPTYIRLENFIVDNISIDNLAKLEKVCGVKFPVVGLRKDMIDRIKQLEKELKDLREENGRLRTLLTEAREPWFSDFHG